MPDPVNEGRAGAGSLASRCRDAARWCGNLPARGLIALVRIYQYTLSPFIGRQCRFEPTCSHYFIGCVQKYGAVRGAWRGVLRICRCHPFHPGGFDPP